MVEGTDSWTKDKVVVEVRYRGLIETEVRQEPKNTIETLIASFGGTLGLMCGMSAVSIIELIIWSVLLVASAVVNLCKKVSKHLNKMH